MIEFDDAGPIMQSFLLEAKKKCIYFSYGEFDGLRVPSEAELYVLKGLIDGAIVELQRKNNES